MKQCEADGELLTVEVIVRIRRRRTERRIDLPVGGRGQERPIDLPVGGLNGMREEERGSKEGGRKGGIYTVGGGEMMAENKEAGGVRQKSLTAGEVSGGLGLRWDGTHQQKYSPAVRCN